MHIYAMIQNKFHFALTGNTAAEIIYQYDVLKDNGKISRKMAGDLNVNNKMFKAYCASIKSDMD